MGEVCLLLEEKKRLQEEVYLYIMFTNQPLVLRLMREFFDDMSVKIKFGIPEPKQNIMILVMTIASMRLWGQRNMAIAYPVE